MSTKFHHGVRVFNKNEGGATIRVVSTAIMGLVATAPEADPDAFPLNTPVLLTDPGGAVGKAGPTGTLAKALEAIAEQAQAFTIVVRVNPPAAPGYLPKRADLTYNQADHPDLVERIGLSGSGTFSLVELHGDFIRCLDDERSVSVGRSVRSAGAGAHSPHTHRVADPTHNHYLADPTHNHYLADATHNHYLADVMHSHRVADAMHSHHIADPTHSHHIADPTHSHNVAGPTHSHYLADGMHSHRVADAMHSHVADATHSRNVAFPAWVSY